MGNHSGMEETISIGCNVFVVAGAVSALPDDDDDDDEVDNNADRAVVVDGKNASAAHLTRTKRSRKSVDVRNNITALVIK